MFLFLMKSFAILVAMSGQTQAEKPLRKQTKFRKISKNGGKYKIAMIAHIIFC